MKSNFPPVLKRLTGMAALVTAFGLAADRPAHAFTKADSDTIVNAYLKTFVRTDGENSFIKADQNGGRTGFWQEIEQVEGVEDANDRSGGAYSAQVTSLLNGFVKEHGRTWGDNKYNDDISWAVIAYARGYLATKNTKFRDIAKDNFDLMYARAWNPQKGALYWTTDNNTYNSCIECPAGIAAVLLSKALDDNGYLDKAKAFFKFNKENLFDAKTGAVWDAVNIKGRISTWASSYNQGTFVGLANYLGDTDAAKLAADYTKEHLGNRDASGYVIMPEYGAGGGNNAGFNSIGMRWISMYMRDHKLEDTYMKWLQANADAAWKLRRTADNLSWCQWTKPTPDGVLHSWDCINSVVALQVAAPDEVAKP